MRPTEAMSASRAVLALVTLVAFPVVWVARTYNAARPIWGSRPRSPTTPTGAKSYGAKAVEPGTPARTTPLRSYFDWLAP